MTEKNGLKSGIFELLVYSALAVVYTYSSYIDYLIDFNRSFDKIGLNNYSSFGGRFKFLTIINLLLQTIYFILCTLNAFFETLFSNKAFGSNKLRRFLNVYYNSITFPIGFVVCTCFWGIFAIEQDLIYPKAIEKVVPSWLNHVMHTFPIFSALIDSYLTRHSYHPSFYKGISLTILFSSFYLIWVYIIAFYGGFWVYPFMKVMTPIQLSIFFAGCFVLAAFTYKLGKVTNSFFWPERQLKVRIHSDKKD